MVKINIIVLFCRYAYFVASSLAKLSIQVGGRHWCYNNYSVMFPHVRVMFSPKIVPNNDISGMQSNKKLIINM